MIDDQQPISVRFEPSVLFPCITEPLKIPVGICRLIKWDDPDNRGPREDARMPRVTGRVCNVMESRLSSGTRLFDERGASYRRVSSMAPLLVVSQGPIFGEQFVQRPLIPTQCIVFSFWKGSVAGGCLRLVPIDSWKRHFIAHWECSSCAGKRRTASARASLGSSHATRGCRATKSC